MCCDSAHKTLPVLTGGAYLHIAKDFPVSKETAKEKTALFSSTSPSYLILLSLDLCNAYLAEHGKNDFTALHSLSQQLRAAAKSAGFSEQKGICDDTKLTLDGADHGLTGEELAGYFRKMGIECEYAGERHVVFMLSPQNTEEDIARLITAISHAPYGHTRFPSPTFSLPVPVNRFGRPLFHRISALEQKTPAAGLLRRPKLLVRPASRLSLQENELIRLY